MYVYHYSRNYINKYFILTYNITLILQPQDSLPDIFIWLVSERRRLAYYRIPARHIIYSDNSEERGKFCGKMQTLFFKVVPICNQ